MNIVLTKKSLPLFSDFPISITTSSSNGECTI